MCEDSVCGKSGSVGEKEIMNGLERENRKRGREREMKMLQPNADQQMYDYVCD